VTARKAQARIGRPREWLSRHSAVLFALGSLVLVLALGVVYPGENGAFFEPYTHSSTLGQIAGFTILACGLTIVILSGGIDLSVGSLVALTGVVAAVLAVRLQWPGWLAAAAGIALGGVCGAASGLAIAGLRLQPFIATLAMMAFARGLAKSGPVSHNSKILMLDLPEAWAILDGKIPVLGWFDLPFAVVPAVLCVLVVLVVLRLTPIGVWVYAVGDNEQAARYSGVPVARTKVLAYTLSGLLAGLSGVVFAAREHQANPDGGIGYELTAIAMVVIGGTALSGGRGGVLLTALGALTIGYLQRILDINGLDTSQQLMITGGIIVVAVLVQGIRGTRFG
jgi:ribose transport system permease protein